MHPYKILLSILCFWLAIQATAYAQAPAATDMTAKTPDNLQPTYPEESRRRGEQGTPIVKVLVGEDGRVEQIELYRSSGYPRLDDAAMTAIRDWRFKPTTNNGEPITQWVHIPLKFKLD